MKPQDLKAMVLATLLAPILNDRTITKTSAPDIEILMVTYSKAADIIISYCNAEVGMKQPPSEMD